VSEGIDAPATGGDAVSEGIGAAATGRAAVSDGIDRRSLSLLAAGHACVDMAQGAVPALLPFLVAQRGLSYGAAASLVLAISVGSSAIQPLFGLGSDRLALPWLMPVGVLLAGLGVAAVGLTSSYAATAAAVTVAGIGVAAFHPEAARFANQVSGERRGKGMSLFSLGGNAGLALGPILVTPIVLALGLRGTVLLAALPLAVAVVLVADLGRLRRVAASKVRIARRAAAARDADPDEWGAFARLGTVISLRSGIYFGLQSFVPAWFIAHLGTSEGAGNAALAAMVVAGAAGTYTGGRIVDRVGRRLLLIGTTAIMLPLLVAFVLAPSPLAAGALVAVIGFVLISSFPLTVVMGQEYLPSRLGLASGVTLGLAIGVGGMAAAGLGALADARGLSAVMWLIAALPIPMLALARTLPVTAAERRARAAAARRPEAVLGARPRAALGEAAQRR
jgi:MFS transporter, FSR family, fosmidomycin resistance protein